jgi:uncharacterized protein YyaL (SSP411 family)
LAKVGFEVYRTQNETNKLVIVSIGYSSCHWCHVMEEETFEEEAVADYMNANFISIKVDREEHPDIDQLYMTATQMMTGSGGWPLNVICLPDGRPVYGGTYHTQEQWMEVLGKVQKLYTNDKSQLEEFAQRVAMGIQEVNRFEVNPEPQALSKSILEEEMKYWSREWDTLNGGERRTQKFITPTKFNYLLQLPTTDPRHQYQGVSRKKFGQHRQKRDRGSPTRRILPLYGRSGMENSPF